VTVLLLRAMPRSTTVLIFETASKDKLSELWNHFKQKGKSTLPAELS